MVRKYFKPIRRIKSEKGFTLLLAALVASIVLSVGAAIFAIAQKQLTLSAIGRDSQFAFYAADTAAECALYWDFRHSFFGTTPPSTVVSPDPRCDSQPMSITLTEGDRAAGNYYKMTSARMDLFTGIVPNIEYCAEVAVTKCRGTFTSEGACQQGAATDPTRTIIHADGYSTNCDSILTSARALQRSVELHY